jgi:hypothetical protein
MWLSLTPSTGYLPMALHITAVEKSVFAALEFAGVSAAPVN